MKKCLFLVCIIMILLLVGCVAPHTHNFIEGICECGDVDPNYQKHEHNFIEGVCECGEVDPNYHKHDFYWDTYCPCGEFEDIHNFDNGVCSCGLNENLTYPTISDLYDITCQPTYISHYFENVECHLMLMIDGLAPPMFYSSDSEFISYFLEILNIEYYSERDLYNNNELPESLFGDMLSSCHVYYSFRIFYITGPFESLLIHIYSNGIVHVFNQDNDYYSSTNINFEELQIKCYKFRE